MQGAKVEGEVSLYINGVKEQSISGDILFTNYGISGFAVLDISQMASEALINFQAVDISVNLLPNFNAQKLSNHIYKNSQANPKLSIFDILLGILPVKTVNGILESLTLDPALLTIDIKLSKKIANQILNWKFEVNSTHGFRHAEVSGGGVDTQEIDPKTFASKKDPQVYFIGEVLDVVGRRGGFNFTFAWASAYACAQHIVKNSI